MWVRYIRRMILKGKTEALEESPVPVPFFPSQISKWTCLASNPSVSLQVEKSSASLASLYWRSGYFTLKANTIKRFEGTKMR